MSWMVISPVARITPVWQVTYVTFSPFLAGKKSQVEHCMGTDLCGEVGKICNIFIFFGTKKQKKKHNKSVIVLCGSSAWNAPCVAKK